jgi:sugar O-acyltransferase (sialic acid O-acetyltransferase NeuD family)
LSTQVPPTSLTICSESVFMLNKVIIAGTGFPELVHILKDSTDEEGNEFEILGFVDDNLANKSRDLLGLPFLGSFDILEKFREDVFVFNSISRDVLVKKDSTERLLKLGAIFSTSIHRTALVAPNCHISQGCIVGPYVILENNCVLNKYVTVNSQSIIAHDSKIGLMTIINYGSILCGSTTVGDHVYIGSRSVIHPDVTIGNGSVIGACSNIVHSIDDNSMYCDAPAVRLK